MVGSGYAAARHRGVLRSGREGDGKAEAVRLGLALVCSRWAEVRLAAQEPLSSCDALSGLNLQDATSTTGSDVAAGPSKPSASSTGATMSVPAFRRVAATLKPARES